MRISLFQILSVVNCHRLPNLMFRGESLRKVCDLVFDAEKGFEIVSTNNRSLGKFSQVYSYDPPAVFGRAVGAYLRCVARSTVDEPWIDVWSDDGFVVVVNKRLVFPDWCGHGTRYFKVFVHVGKGSEVTVEVYWFDFCWGGRIALKFNGLVDLDKPAESSAVSSSAVGKSSESGGSRSSSSGSSR